MNRQQRALIRAQHEFVNKYPAELTPIDPAKFPELDVKPSKAWVSRKYLVQLFYERSDIYTSLIRLSINRTKLGDNGHWEDGLSWDELQAIKRDIGYGDWYGVEVYPQDSQVVNVANIRHLWLLPTPLTIGWFDPAKADGQ